MTAEKRLVVEDGIGWMPSGDGRLYSATPKDYVAEIERLRAENARLAALAMERRGEAMSAADLVTELRTMARELSTIVGEPVKENTAWRAAAEIERLRNALKQIQEIKDVGADFPDKFGRYVNDSAGERDAMYKVAVTTLGSAVDVGGERG
jgi:hypothetical protein